MIFGKGERCCTLLYYKRTFFIKARKYRRFGNVRIIIRWHKKSTDFGTLFNAISVTSLL